VCQHLGGELTGKDPTNRGKLGTKRHLVVDRTGIPLAVTISGANVHDSRMLEASIDAIPALRQPQRRRGRPRQRPTKLHADRGYDYPRCRQALRRRGIIPGIARRGIDSSERLGRFRWVVERTLSWLNRFRRLKVRYERRADIHQGFLSLGCALICWNALGRQ
jgi:IS5 family transposase